MALRRPLRPRLSSSPGSFASLYHPRYYLRAETERIFRSSCPESRRVITGFLTRTLPLPPPSSPPPPSSSSSPSPSPPPLLATLPRAHTPFAFTPSVGVSNRAILIDRGDTYLHGYAAAGKEEGRNVRGRER